MHLDHVSMLARVDPAMLLTSFCNVHEKSFGYKLTFDCPTAAEIVI